MDDLISTIQISPAGPSAARSARRPDGSDNSLTTEKPSACNSRVVPRATASAVADWRPSGGRREGAEEVTAMRAQPLWALAGAARSGKACARAGAVGTEAA